MEGVGARFGRSSTRYGPTTVFTGPVRKWKKKWIHVTPPITTAASNDKHQQSNGNSIDKSNNASHILLYKWTPISQNHKTSSANENSNGDENNNGEVDEEPPRRKMKYIPIAVLEEQNNDAAEVQTDEPNPVETEAEGSEKPDIDMEENQVSEKNHVELKKSTTGLSLNLNAREGDTHGDGDEEAIDQTNDIPSE